MASKNRTFNWIMAGLGGVILLVIFLPVFKILVSLPLPRILETLRDAEVTGSILLTLRASLWATLLAVVFGIPLAYFLARHEFRGKRLIEGLVDLPVIIPHTAAGIALLVMIGRHSMFHRLTSIRLVGTEAAVVAAMFFVSVPFLINGAKEGFRDVDPRYEKTAVTLGASSARAFFTVTLPLSRRSIISGMLMMWGRGISEFGAVVILAYHPKTAPVLIFERFQNYGLDHAVGVTVLLILVSLLVFSGIRYLTRRR